MPRVKGGITTRARKKKVFKRAKGYWGAKKNQFRMRINCLQYCIGIQAEVLPEQYTFSFHSIYLGADSIHAIGGINSDYIVPAWLTQDPEKHINAFIATISQENLIRRDSL